MRTRKTSRVLNDESFLLGLSYNDVTFSGLLMLLLMMITKSLGFESMLWPLSFMILDLVLLIPVRLKFRRKIIRDTFYYLFTHGVIRVSKNR